MVHVSSWAAQKYGGNVVYGLAKAATDRMASDMAHQLQPHGVTVVSMYPGLVRTEAVLAAGVFDLSNSESPEFIGRAVSALAGDAEVLRRTGRLLWPQSSPASTDSPTSMVNSRVRSALQTCDSSYSDVSLPGRLGSCG